MAAASSSKLEYSSKGPKSPEWPPMRRRKSREWPLTRRRSTPSHYQAAEPEAAEALKPEVVEREAMEPAASKAEASKPKEAREEKGSDLWAVEFDGFHGWYKAFNCDGELTWISPQDYEKEEQADEKAEQADEAPRTKARAKPGFKYFLMSDQGRNMFKNVPKGEPDSVLPIVAIPKGDVVELFQWDSSRQWRWCYWPKGKYSDPPEIQNGWVRLKGPDMESIQPVDGPDWQSLGIGDFRDYFNEPCFLAVYENNARHLKEFMAKGLVKRALTLHGSRGHDLLKLAVRWGHMDCVVLLLREVESYPEPLQNLASTPPSKALLEALAGSRNFDTKSFEQAMALLCPDAREAAKAILEEFRKQELMKVKKAQQMLQRQIRKRMAEAEAERARLRAEEEEMHQRREACRLQREQLGINAMVQRMKARHAEMEAMETKPLEHRDDVSQFRRGAAKLEHQMNAKREIEEEEKLLQEAVEIGDIWKCLDCGETNSSFRLVCFYCGTSRSQGYIATLRRNSAA